MKSYINEQDTCLSDIIKHSHPDMLILSQMDKVIVVIYVIMNTA